MEIFFFHRGMGKWNKIKIHNDVRRKWSKEVKIEDVFWSWQPSLPDLVRLLALSNNFLCLNEIQWSHSQQTNMLLRQWPYLSAHQPGSELSLHRPCMHIWKYHCNMQDSGEETETNSWMHSKAVAGISFGFSFSFSFCVLSSASPGLEVTGTGVGTKYFWIALHIRSTDGMVPISSNILIDLG